MLRFFTGKKQCKSIRWDFRYEARVLMISLYPSFIYLISTKHKTLRSGSTNQNRTIQNEYYHVYFEYNAFVLVPLNHNNILIYDIQT